MQEIILFIQHHWILSLALITIVILLLLLEWIKLKTGTARLTPSQLTQLINHKNAIVIDIRNADAYATGHIIDAISIPLADIEKKYKKIEPFRNQPIIIVCNTGADSERATTTLTQKGFQTYLLQGGMRAWRDAGMPLVKSG